MILIASLGVVVATVIAAGGRLGRLAALRLRHPELVLAALLLQVLVINVVPTALPGPVAAAIHLATYAMAALFVYLNRRIRGLWLIMVGGGCNLAAIAANGGEMPASRRALAASGRLGGSGFHNSGVVAHAHLAFLGDIFDVPRGWPLANVFSAGDIGLLIGAFIFLHVACGSRLGRRARRVRPDDEVPVPA
jgi:hypothetical protein